MVIEVKVMNVGGQVLPAYATEMSAGMDLRADIKEAVDIHPMERVLVKTGLRVALPEGYECQIRPRSGLALKHGITVLNAPGTIDADYRGEIGVILVNLSSQMYKVMPGERIAQMVFSKYERVEYDAVDALDETERGDGGYGHTGK